MRETRLGADVLVVETRHITVSGAGACPMSASARPERKLGILEQYELLTEPGARGRSWDRWRVR